MLTNLLLYDIPKSALGTHGLKVVGDVPVNPASDWEGEMQSWIWYYHGTQMLDRAGCYTPNPFAKIQNNWVN